MEMPGFQYNSEEALWLMIWLILSQRQWIMNALFSFTVAISEGL